MNLAEISLQQIGIEHKTILKNMFQFYIYEFSAILPRIKLKPDGTFSIPDVTAYLTQNHYHTFLISFGHDLAGFVIVNTNADSNETRIISEFFVLQKYARKGVGTSAAMQAFGKFPGKWRIHQVATNYRAQAFWRKVVNDYTNGAFTEWFDDSRRSFQEFETSKIPDKPSDLHGHLAR